MFALGARAGCAQYSAAPNVPFSFAYKKFTALYGVLATIPGALVRQVFILANSLKFTQSKYKIFIALFLKQLTTGLNINGIAWHTNNQNCLHYLCSSGLTLSAKQLFKNLVPLGTGLH